MKKLILATCLASSSALFGKGMVVAPARIELRLAPGESRTVPITVGNTDFVPFSFRVRVFPLELTETGEVLFETLPQPLLPPKSWIEVSPEELEVGAGVSGTIRLRVTAPSSATGTIAGSVLVSLPAAGRAESGVAITTEPRVLVPVYLTVAGTEKPGAEVTSLETSRDPEGVFHFRAILKNTGNTLLRPAGTWVLEQSGAAGPVEVLVVPFSGDPVLPGKARKFEGEGRGKVPAGDLTGSVFFDFGAAKADVASKSAPVHAVEAAPARETQDAAKGVTREVTAEESAALPLKMTLVKGGILLTSEGGHQVRSRSEVTENPPGLIVDLVGYRIDGPLELQGARLVSSATAEQVQAHPTVTRLKVRFRVPVVVKVKEDPRGLFVELTPKPARSE